MDGAYKRDGKTPRLRSLLPTKWTWIFLLSFLKMPQIFAISPDHLRVGDVILIELDCYSCKAISQSTNGRYHHSGLVLEIDEKGVILAQSLTKVETVSLPAFLKQAAPDSMVAHLRPREFEEIFNKNSKAFYQKTYEMRHFFLKNFLGLPFDPEFLWENFSPTGEELLYCSEMIQKTLNTALQDPFETISMDFSNGYEFWYQYFDGKIPQGEPGNSPASLLRAREMMVVSEEPIIK